VTKDFKYVSFDLEYPTNKDPFVGMSSYEIKAGPPYRNITDIVKQFKFEAVQHIKIYAIGQAADSKFDIGISLSVLSTQNVYLLEQSWILFSIIFSGLFLIYCCSLIVRYRNATDITKY